MFRLIVCAGGGLSAVIEQEDIRDLKMCLEPKCLLFLTSAGGGQRSFATT